jgi:hypothetical protein
LLASLSAVWMLWIVVMTVLMAAVEAPRTDWL